MDKEMKKFRRRYPSRRRDKSLERLTKIVGNGVLAIKDYRKWLDHPKVKQQLEESKKLRQGGGC